MIALATADLEQTPESTLDTESLARSRPISQESSLGSLDRIHRSQPIQVSGISRKIYVKIANDADEWEQAFRLVAANYQSRGYEAPSPKPFRFTPYHALPDSIVAVAKEGSQVVATVSIILDNTFLGLPMEAIYQEEIMDLRHAGRHMGEVTSLADQTLGVREFIPVLVALVRLTCQYHVSQGGNTAVITINPRHRNFYCKVLGFTPLGPKKPYPMVRDHPAEAYVQDLHQMQVTAPKMYEYLFRDPLPRSALTAQPMPSALLRYWGSQSSQTNVDAVNQIIRFADKFGNPRRW